MNWIEDIKYNGWKKYSQTKEEGYIHFILHYIIQDNLTETFVDIGAGLNISNTRYFKELGWKGLCLDGEPTDTDTIKAWITKDNICGFLKLANIPETFGLLSIDLDGNDYHILNELLKEYKPLVICSEINGIFPIDKSVAIKYNPTHIWNNDDYYGYSLGAGLKLADKFGYRIIFQNDSMVLTSSILV